MGASRFDPDRTSSSSKVQRYAVSALLTQGPFGVTMMFSFCILHSAPRFDLVLPCLWSYVAHAMMLHSLEPLANCHSGSGIARCVMLAKGKDRNPTRRPGPSECISPFRQACFLTHETSLAWTQLTRCKLILRSIHPHALARGGLRSRHASASDLRQY